MTTDIKQGTQAWHDSRRGQVTASRIVDVMAKGQGITRAKYMAELIDKLTTTEQPPSYTNAYMEWGIEQEPKARQLYEFVSGNTVEEVGYFPHPSIERSGASPDGIVTTPDDQGLLEIKCPATSTHRNHLLTGKIDKRYIYQMQFQMACAEKQWCDFVSYDPRMINPNLRLSITRVERDNELIEIIETAVIEFLDEMKQQLEQLDQIGESK